MRATMIAKTADAITCPRLDRSPARRGNLPTARGRWRRGWDCCGRPGRRPFRARRCTSSKAPGDFVEPGGFVHGLLGTWRLAPARGPREISLLTGRWAPAERRERNFVGCATGPPFGRYPRFVAATIGGLRATRFREASGGEGGIRTHEHPLRCYWNSSPAPSTARPPLRSITYDSPRERIEAEGPGPMRAAHDKPCRSSPHPRAAQACGVLAGCVTLKGGGSSRHG